MSGAKRLIEDQINQGILDEETMQKELEAEEAELDELFGERWQKFCEEDKQPNEININDFRLNSERNLKTLEETVNVEDFRLTEEDRRVLVQREPKTEKEKFDIALHPEQQAEFARILEEAKHHGNDCRPGVDLPEPENYNYIRNEALYSMVDLSNVSCPIVTERLSGVFAEQSRLAKIQREATQKLVAEFGCDGPTSLMEAVDRAIHMYRVAVVASRGESNG